MGNISAGASTPTAGLASIGQAIHIPTQCSFSVRFVSNGIIVQTNGSNPERGYYNDEAVFTNLDDALVHIRNIAATPANT
jgi:hypothetical protein